MPRASRQSVSTVDAAAQEAPRTDEGPDPRTWGLGDALLGFALAQVAATVIYVILVGASHYSAKAPTGVGGAVGEVTGRLGTGQAPGLSQPVPLVLTVLLQIPLWAALFLVPVWAAKTKGRGPVRDFGLRMTWIDLPLGLAIGTASQLLAVPALYWLIFKVIGTQDVSAVARTLTDRATSPVGVVALFVIVGVGAPLAEEVFFRGLTQRSFKKRGMRWQWAVAVTALVFAASHFEPLQFPALFLFGLLLGWLAHRTGRLGTSIIAHLAFNVSAAASLVWGLGWG